MAQRANALNRGGQNYIRGVARRDAGFVAGLIEKWQHLSEEDDAQHEGIRRLRGPPSSDDGETNLVERKSRESFETAFALDHH